MSRKSGAIHNADLTAGGLLVNMTMALPLTSNVASSYQGPSKKGSFDIPGALARDWLCSPNPHGRSNGQVVKPWQNGRDILQNRRDMWIVDFGTSMSEEDACLFELPFNHAEVHVKPVREKNNRESYRKYWWRHAEARVALRKALEPLPRYIATVRVSKHRIFVWADKSVLPDDSLIVITRADDTSFGILHSRFHELWSLRLCTFLGVGNDPRYTPSSTYETFHFPTGLTPADTKGQAHSEGELQLPPVTAEHLPAAYAIASAAQRLNGLRENWLNPAEWVERVPEVVAGYPERIVAKPEHAAELKKRTLTNLYNARPAWLDNAHKTLDLAVAHAYGWSDYTAAMSDEEILRRLLVLNQQRSV